MCNDLSKKELRERWKADEFVLTKRSALEGAFKIKDSQEPTDLRGIVVGLDGAIDWLAWADLQDVRLENVDLGSGKFSCSFIRGRFRSVCFAGSEFDTCRFTKAHFVDVDFTQALLLAPWLEDAVFTGCRFQGARFRGRGKALPTSSGSRIKFERCDFSDSTFECISIAGVSFVDCSFQSTCFRDCQVFNWRFSGEAPRRDQFINCQYRGKNTGLDCADAPD